MKKVLIIEDDPMVALINSEYLLKIDGIEIVGQGSSEKEVFFYLENYEVDIILLDIYLKDENGIDILQKIRSSGYTTDIIMITSSNGNSDVKKALALGCVDYLIKPFDFDRFKICFDKIFQKEKLLQSKVISQGAIDNMGFNENVNFNSFPKGINKNTLNIVMEAIKNIHTDEFAIKDICDSINLSNVTTKKYLDYLESIEYISSFSTYGNVGRPSFLYTKKAE